MKLNESIIYYSPPFEEFLKWARNKIQIDSSNYNRNIANELLSSAGINIKDDMSFINLSDELDKVSFDKMNNIKKSMKIKYDKYGINIDDIDNKYSKSLVDSIYRNDSDSETGPWYTNSRNKVKIGRIINKILTKNVDNTEIEKFVDLYKIYNNKNKYTLSIVKGDDIYKYYERKNYTEYNYGGELSGSCMIDKSKDFFKIYTENEDVCNMLIALNGDNKLVGRALIWKLNKRVNGYSLYLDRPYTIDKKVLDMFNNYAIKNDLLSYNKVGIKTPDNKVLKTKLVVKLKEYKFDDYPYMDTFRRLDNEYLYNDSNTYEHGIILDSTNGSYTKCTPRILRKIKRFFEF